MLLPFDIGYRAKVMGCACSKTHAHTATEQVKRGRATLQLDLSASSPEVERVGTVPNQKKVRTPAVTPRSVAALDSASERTRRPRSITEYGIFVGSTFACEVAPAVGVKTPRNRSVSTADISTESDSDDNIAIEDSNEGDGSRGEGACKDAVEHVAEPMEPRSLEDSEGCSNKAQRRQEGVAIGPDSFSRVARRSRPRRAIRDMPVEAMLPPGPGELRAFLRKHRPREKPSDRLSKLKGACHILFPDGRRYVGQLGSDDLPGGWGTLVLADGIVYEGSWRDGRVHGEGTLRLPNGNTFWGSWAEGRKHGKGTFQWADGSRYDGFYRAGRRSGVGSLRYASGATYEGKFECDLRQGSGRLMLPCGSFYDGEWLSDQPHGYGVYVDAGPDGERFEGRWNHGVRSGAGTLVQYGDSGSDEDDKVDCKVTAWYSGKFDAGLPHGNGMMGYGHATFCGHIEHGAWTGGGGRVDLGEGRGSFEGTWHDGLPQGRGRWSCPRSGIEIDGTFKEVYAKLVRPV